jgi:hypothetical protein
MTRLRDTGRRAGHAAMIVGRGTRRTASTAGQATHRWALRPSGRFVLPALVLAALLAGAGSAGGYLVPATAPERPLTQPSQPSDGLGGGLSDGTGLPNGDQVPGQPDGTDPSDAPLPGADDGSTGARPADTLAAWAKQLSPVVGIPVVALQAYGYGQLRSQQTDPGCHLTWTTLAGIGKIESDHGREGGTVLQPDGKALPPIIGAALDGVGNRAKVLDHDHGLYDGDTTYDRAVGPMQFLPTTWENYQVDADLDGISDPNDINDSALAAAKYLCAGNRDLSVGPDWWSGVLSYNNLRSYAEDVFAAADNYGVLSR